MNRKDNYMAELDTKYLKVEKYKNIKSGTEVKHSAYGKGIIEYINLGQIVVRFEESNNKVEIRKFMFPNAFVDGYLKV